MKNNKNKKIFFLKAFMAALLVMSVYYYFLLPPINLNSPEFWIFFCAFLFAFSFFSALLQGIKSFEAKTLSALPYSLKLVLTVPIIAVIISFVNLIVSPIFNAKAFSERITISQDTNFEEDVAEFDVSRVPLLDKDSTRKVGDRVMGELPELVSQFDVSNLYTQINYGEKIVRVTPLEYSGFIKYLTNRKDGIKAYIMVDSTNGKSSLVKLEKGMKYAPSAAFNENLYRKLRFSYPTAIISDVSFEIDNEGKPYWIAPVYSYRGVGIMKEVSGAIILDPISGKSKKYKLEDIPEWVDHVYSADLILEQTNNWGMYKSGFLNSLFGQKNVVQTTEGYNYLLMNNDVYLYTGVTSATSDEANIGFILSNLRTQETHYYKVPGAEEFSAMDSAEGQVQQMQYSSTFPLLINLHGKPTYLMSLKDNAGLVKMYALVDVQNYQNVSVTPTSEGIERAVTNYLGEIKEKVDTDKNLIKEIKIEAIAAVFLDGNTYYYIQDLDSNKYKVSLKLAENILPFVKKGDKLILTYQSKDELNIVYKVEQK